MNDIEPGLAGMIHLPNGNLSPAARARQPQMAADQRVRGALPAADLMAAIALRRRRRY
jgi:hypothetical protein